MLRSNIDGASAHDTAFWIVELRSASAGVVVVRASFPVPRAADVIATFNETEVTAVDDGEGIYTVILTEEWTTGKVGIHSLRIDARKAGYDTLSVTLADFMLIRSSPLLIVLLGAGIIIGVVVLYYYRKYRRGDEIFPRRGKSKSTRFKDKSKEEKQRQKKNDEEFDPAEFFGVE